MPHHAARRSVGRHGGRCARRIRSAAERVRDFAREERGATAIEYALIASLIFLAVVTAVRQMGVEVADVLTFVGNAMD